MRSARSPPRRKPLARSSTTLMLIDLGLPDGDGKLLIKSLRAQGSLGADPGSHGTGLDRRPCRYALDCGADDFLMKPFNHIEFLARCRALLRRSGPHRAERIEFGRLEFDPASGSVRVGGRHRAGLAARAIAPGIAAPPRRPRGTKGADRNCPIRLRRRDLDQRRRTGDFEAPQAARTRRVRHRHRDRQGGRLPAEGGQGPCLSGFRRLPSLARIIGSRIIVFALLAMAVQVAVVLADYYFDDPKLASLMIEGETASLGQRRERRPQRPELRGSTRHEALPGIERRLLHTRAHAGGTRRLLQLRRELRPAPAAAGAKPSGPLVAPSTARQAHCRGRRPIL